ncbi:MAG: hypothetical protein WDM88_12860 [Galbitalea sp.]
MRRTKRRRARTITLIVFLLVILGCGFAILSLGTSTGLTFGGTGTEVMAQTGSNPMFAQVGWLRNTAPWPITITSITTDARNSSARPTVYLERQHSGSTAVSVPKANWTLNASRPPFQLDGGALRYVGFELKPRAGRGVRPDQHHGHLHGSARHHLPLDIQRNPGRDGVLRIAPPGSWHPTRGRTRPPSTATSPPSAPCCCSPTRRRSPS